MSMRAVLAAALALAAFPATAQDVTADQLFAMIGRCSVQAGQLEKALAEAKAKIAELTKPPPAPAKE